MRRSWSVCLKPFFALDNGFENAQYVVMRHVVYGSVLLLFASIGCFGQTPGPSFEAASIHDRDSADPDDIQVSPGSLVILNRTFFFLVRWAYDVTPAQIDSPPGWRMQLA